MTQDYTLTYDNIDSLAAGAFAKSRDCETAIRVDLMHNLKPQDRNAAGRVLSAIKRRNIFDKELVIELDVLMEKIEQLIQDGTTTVERFDADESNVSAPAIWTEQRRTRQAEELSRALLFIWTFHETLLAVHDLMSAERAIEKLRQAS